jgi:flagellar M-ring protein FliF
VEIAKINDLVKEAMGYNKDRGDTLNVANSPFNVSEKEVIPDVPFWKQPATFVLAKEVGKHLLIAAAVLYLLLGVVRPLLIKLAQPRPVEVLAEGALESEATGRRSINAGYEQNLQIAKQLAAQEPMIVANVVKDWVSGDER